MSHPRKHSTTYRDEFEYRSHVLPSLSFYQEPCLYENGEKLSPRCFPISMPIFPNRKRDSEIPIAAGFETYVHRMKPISLQKYEESLENPACDCKIPVKVEEFFNDVPDVIIEELVKIRTYTPSSHLQMFTPIERKEMKPQLIRNSRTNDSSELYKPFVYQNEPEKWQKIGCIWDKLQERRGISRIDVTNRSLKGASRRLLARPRMQRTMKNVENLTENKQNLHHPLSYRLPLFGHNGSLSRTVTSIQQCNLLNKTSKHTITLS